MLRTQNYIGWSCIIIFFLCLSLQGKAQKTWTLDDCIDYAYEHNIYINSAKMQVLTMENTYKQSRNNRFPTLSYSSSLASQFGRSIDPTTNSYTNTHITYNSMGFSSGITLFNWFSVKNTIKCNSKNVEVANLETERLKNDLKLNIAAAYLQVLLAEKQLEISQQQIDLTLQQLDITSKQVEYGKKPKSDRLQIVGELSSDSTTYFNQLSAIQQAKLQVMLLLNIDPQDGFEINKADTVVENQLPILEEPEYIYEIAKIKQPLQKEDKLKLEALGYQKAISKASFYPTLSANATISSNYSNAYTNSYGNPYSYFNQLFNINLYQYVGLSLSIPIFNNKTAYYNYKNICVQIKTQQLQNEGDNQQLKQDIYNAYNTAHTNLSVYMSTKRTLNATQEGYMMSQKRFEIGKSTLSDYLTALNTLYQAKTNYINAYYNYIFSFKILAFYKV
ncbi:TolC family protein [Rhizosphaericola mali]|uniref:TolC family protein n=1 Tax=Rhizosphaericola mali TaxID=2545455 RepID=A0A5P2FZ38_9BACT|nr:TolC family protein [Rhizosphaericola mali]QES88066.1 TolC family protein [Rhizosphaericola mali]QES88786.1 TolC family protein [Rhizosphaericola mali]